MHDIAVGVQDLDEPVMCVPLNSLGRSTYMPMWRWCLQDARLCRGSGWENAGRGRRLVNPQLAMVALVLLVLNLDREQLFEPLPRSECFINAFIDVIFGSSQVNRRGAFCK